jgi:hypothetical protein
MQGVSTLGSRGRSMDSRMPILPWRSPGRRHRLSTSTWVSGRGRMEPAAIRVGEVSVAEHHMVWALGPGAA